MKLLVLTLLPLTFGPQSVRDTEVQRFPFQCARRAEEDRTKLSETPTAAQSDGEGQEAPDSQAPVALAGGRIRHLAPFQYSERS